MAVFVPGTSLQFVKRDLETTTARRDFAIRTSALSPGGTVALGFSEDARFVRRPGRDDTSRGIR